MKQEILQLTGGAGKDKRRALDFYPTPPECTIALLHFLHDNALAFETTCTIWEPACGELKSMSKVISGFGHKVISTDIITGTDFLNCSPIDCDAIITNPPFNLSTEFIRRSTKICRISAMLLKSQYWHAKERLPLFNELQPAWVLPLTWRPDFLFHERKNNEKGSPTMEVAWSVWIRGNNQTRYQPLNRPK